MAYFDTALFTEPDANKTPKPGEKVENCDQLFAGEQKKDKPSLLPKPEINIGKLNIKSDHASYKIDDKNEIFADYNLFGKKAGGSIGFKKKL